MQIFRISSVGIIVCSEFFRLPIEQKQIIQNSSTLSVGSFSNAYAYRSSNTQSGMFQRKTNRIHEWLCIELLESNQNIIQSMQFEMHRILHAIFLWPDGWLRLFCSARKQRLDYYYCYDCYNWEVEQQPLHMFQADFTRCEVVKTEMAKWHSQSNYSFTKRKFKELMKF